MMTSPALRRLRTSFLAVLAIGATLSFPQSGAIAVAADAPPPVQAGATTVISSEGGLTGVLIDLPEGTTLAAGGLAVELAHETTAGRAMLRQPQHVAYCDFCFSTASYYRDLFFGSEGDDASTDLNYPFDGCSTDEGQPVPCSIGGGVFELYLVSDGPMEATLTINTGQGAVRVDTRAAVDGVFQRLEGECLTPACTIQYGGATHDVGDEGRLGYAAVLAWEARADGPVLQLSPNFGFAQACAYPGFSNPAGSPDPADHPRGCDEVRVRTDAVAVPRVQPDVWLAGAYRTHSDGNLEVSGPQYLGFQVRQTNTLGDSKAGAWALWLTEGISCQSSTWDAC